MWTSEDDTNLRLILSITDAVARRCFVELVKGQYPYVDQNGHPVAAIEVEGSVAETLARLDPRAATRTERDRRRVLRDVYARQIEQVEDLLADRLMDVAVAQIDLATGCQVAAKDPLTGEIVKVYTDRPDFKAGDAILSRMMGRPMARQEVDVNTNTQSNVTVYIPDNGRAREGGPPIRYVGEVNGSIIDILPETIVEPAPELPSQPRVEIRMPRREERR